MSSFSQLHRGLLFSFHNNNNKKATKLGLGGRHPFCYLHSNRCCAMSNATKCYSGICRKFAKILLHGWLVISRYFVYLPKKENNTNRNICTPRENKLRHYWLSHYCPCSQLYILGMPQVFLRWYFTNPVFSQRYLKWNNTRSKVIFVEGRLVLCVVPSLFLRMSCCGFHSVKIMFNVKNSLTQRKSGRPIHFFCLLFTFYSLFKMKWTHRGWLLMFCCVSQERVEQVEYSPLSLGKKYPCYLLPKSTPYVWVISNIFSGLERKRKRATIPIKLSWMGKRENWNFFQRVV